MTLGVIIPPLPFEALATHGFHGLADYQEAVGGYIEPLTIARPCLTMYLNEEGKVRDLIPNPRATALWWLLEPSARHRDLVCGAAVVVADNGDPDAEELLEALHTPAQYRAAVRSPRGSREWVTSPLRHVTWFGAAIHALRLEEGWLSTLDLRVVHS